MPNIKIYVEGDTEGTDEFERFIRRAVPELHDNRIGLKIVNNYQSVNKLIRKFPAAAKNSVKDGDFPIALFDLYHNPFYNNGKNHKENIQLAKVGLLNKIDKSIRDGVSIHIAKFETEAWSFADEDNFNSVLKPRSSINYSGYSKPENINDIKNPAKRLKDLFSRHRKKHYSKTVDGGIFFRKLNPELVYDKCPIYQLFIDDLKRITEKIATT